MRFSALSHQPAILVAAVSVLIGLVWYALGRPIAMPHAPLAPAEKIACVSYTPFRGDQSPLDRRVTVPAEQIDADLEELSKITSCVRTYAIAQGLAQVPEFARKHGLTVLQGIWLGRDPERNDQEVQTGIALAQQYRDVIRGLVVGNEVLLRGEMAATDLRDIIEHVRREVGIPVTYADVWEFWLKNPELASAVDFVTIHILPYWEDFPVSAERAARHVTETYDKVTARFPGKQVMLGEVGWPSAGRMRHGALPSPSNQALVMHEVLAAAKRGNWPVNLMEAFDQPWKRQLEGTVGGHWGLLDSDKRALKFRWGGYVSDRPLYVFQGLLGILLALVTFAAAYFSSRSEGEDKPQTINWFPISGIALEGGLFLGWALVQAPLESLTIMDWIRSIILVLIAFITPPVVAAAIVRKTPMGGFVTVLDPLFWRAAKPLERVVVGLFVLSSVAAIAIALGLVFDPRYRDFPFAPLTGPVLTLFIATFASPPGLKRQAVAEQISAAVLAVSAIYIVFNETALNWQAQWFAALLLILAAACLRLRVAQN
jgi:exo-beta-1,3-glucanase (GH17 family)